MIGRPPPTGRVPSSDDVYSVSNEHWMIVAKLADCRYLLPLINTNEAAQIVQVHHE